MNYTDFSQVPIIMNVTQLAKVLDISKNTAYSLIHSNRIEAVEVGHQYRVSKEAVGRLDGFSKGCLLLPSAQAKGLLVVKLGLGQLQLLAPDLVARAFPSSITQEVGGLDVPFMA